MDSSRIAPNRPYAEPDLLAAAPATQGRDDVLADAQTLCAASEQTERDNTHLPRTLGLKTFDVLLYPLLTNTGVFALSVLATYLTSRGGQRNADGKLMYGQVGAFFQRRGDWVVEKLKGLGMSHGQADMSKMVFFSFADGSLLSPMVKYLEDRRGSIGRYIDGHFGTQHDNEKVYENEPKQTWGSVLGGRLATVAIVVPTAVLLEKAGLNDVLFSNPGKKFGEYLTKNTNIAQKFSGLDIPELSKIGFFEAFYTSVCTAGLYVSSRFIARKIEHKTPPLPTDAQACAITSTPAVETATPLQPIITSAPLADQVDSPAEHPISETAGGSVNHGEKRPKPFIYSATAERMSAPDLTMHQNTLH